VVSSEMNGVRFSNSQSDCFSSQIWRTFCDNFWNGTRLEVSYF